MFTAAVDISAVTTAVQVLLPTIQLQQPQPQPQQLSLVRSLFSFLLSAFIRYELAFVILVLLTTTTTTYLRR